MSSLAPSQLQALRQQLQQQKNSLWEEVRTELERSGDQKYADLAGSVTDPGDQAVADMLVDLEAAMVDRQIHAIRDIENALARIAQEHYGDCSDCGGDIGFDRLHAYPTAQRCIRCQAQHEKTHAQEGQPTL